MFINKILANYQIDKERHFNLIKVSINRGVLSAQSGNKLLIKDIN